MCKISRPRSRAPHPKNRIMAEEHENQLDWLSSPGAFSISAVFLEVKRHTLNALLGKGRPDLHLTVM